MHNSNGSYDNKSLNNFALHCDILKKYDFKYGQFNKW
jgi:hypothetical protein